MGEFDWLASGVVCSQPVHECVLGWCIRMAHCGEVTGWVSETGFFHMVVLLLPWVKGVYLCSKFGVVKTMPAVRADWGCVQGSLCFLLVACSDVDILTLCL